MALATFTFQASVFVTAPPVPPIDTTGLVIPFAGPVPNTVALPAGSTPTTVLIENLGPDIAVVLLTTAAATTTGTAAAGSSTVTVASGTGIAVGQAVVDGTTIAPGTFVQAISGTTVTLSRPTIAALSGTTLNFVVPVALGSTGMAVSTSYPLVLAYGSSTFISVVSMVSSRQVVVCVGVGT